MSKKSMVRARYIASLHKTESVNYWSHYTVFALIYAIVVAVIIFYVSLSKSDTFLVVGLTVLLSFVPLFFMRLEYGVIALIIARPIIDTFSQYNILSIQSISFNMNAVLGIAVCVWGGIIILKEQIDLRKIPGMLWIILFLGISTLSLIISLSLTVSLSELLRTSSVFVFYVLGYHLMQKDQHFIVWACNALAASAVVPIALGLFQLLTFSGMSIDGVNNRIFGTFGHPNVLGFYMVLIIGVLFIRYISMPMQHRSLVYPWIMGLAGLTLLFTYTRGAWIGMGIYLFVLGFFKYRKPLVFIGVLLCAVFLFGQTINTLTVNVFNFDLNEIPLVNRFTARNDEADSINWRAEVIAKMAPEVLNSPLLGHGIGNFVTLRAQGDIGLFEDLEAHNDYLRLAIEVGITGLLIYILWIINLFRTSFFNFTIFAKNSWQKEYALGLLGIIAAFYAMSVSDNILQGTPVMWSFMLIVGTMIGIKKPH